MKWFLALSFVCLSLFADTYHDYEKALEASRLAKKPLIVMIKTTHCPWCKRMLNSTIGDPNIKKKIDDQFVFALFNQDTDQFPRELATHMVPTVHFIDQNNDVIWQAIGYRTPQQFQNDIDNALEHYNTKE